VDEKSAITFSMDTLSYSVSRSDFEPKALRVLKLTWAAPRSHRLRIAHADPELALKTVALDLGHCT